MKTIQFQRYKDNPVIRNQSDTFFSVHAANPDLLIRGDTCFFYFRGQDERGHDQIGVATTPVERFDGIHWNLYEKNPVIRVAGPESEFDSAHILDPAAIMIDDHVYLYYTAHQAGWKTEPKPSHTGLAISGDGFKFKKSDKNPLVQGTSPEVVRLGGKIYLLMQKLNQKGVFDIYLCESDDGIVFPLQKQQKVFSPSTQAGAFDSFSISTVRLWREEEWFYMTYGGCDRYFDYPVAIGLARSRDLRHWQRYPGNPVLSRGEPGSWDEGALWFATLYKRQNIYYLWYEGTGTGLGLSTPYAREQSEICRQQDYGAYAESSFSQIGLALFKGDSLKW